MQHVANIQSEVRYSGRTGKRPDIASATHESSIATSPVWPLAAIVFAAAFLLHDLVFAVAVVIAQLSAMTALQWLALWAQRKALSMGMPLFKALPLLRAIRLVVFCSALGAVLL